MSAQGAVHIERSEDSICSVSSLSSTSGAEGGSSRLFVGLWQPSGTEPPNQAMVVRGGGGGDGSLKLSAAGVLWHKGQEHDLGMPNARAGATHSQ